MKKTVAEQPTPNSFGKRFFNRERCYQWLFKDFRDMRQKCIGGPLSAQLLDEDLFLEITTISKADIGYHT